MERPTMNSVTRLLLKLSILACTISIAGIFATNIFFQLARADSVISTIRVGEDPVAVAFGSANGNLM
jgi:hypothetical protein